MAKVSENVVAVNEILMKKNSFFFVESYFISLFFPRNFEHYQTQFLTVRENNKLFVCKNNQKEYFMNVVVVMLDIEAEI